VAKKDRTGKSPPSQRASKGEAPKAAVEAPGAKPAVARGPGTKEVLKSLGTRLGLPLAAGWMLAIFVNKWWSYAIVGAVTAAAAGLVVWAWQRLEKTRKVTDILQSVEPTDKEGRKAALEKIDANFKKGDLAATFAKSQLLMQDDPAQALTELESIDLSKVMPAEADQARMQRAIIHLSRGEVDRARVLVDPIDLSRHEDSKVRAMMTAVVAEAWARTGQAKRGMELLDIYKADDASIAEIRPQLWRARAFASAALNDMKAMRFALRRLGGENPQYLMVFMVKRVHPLLQQEAKQMLMASGHIPRQRQQFQRR
jgi:hypothetical protein